MEKKERTYTVTILEAQDSCDNDLFRKMAQKGDITAEKVMDHIGEIINVSGYALCNIKTAEKEFNIYYVNTDKGLFSTGSEIFVDSITDYLEDTSLFKISEIKTKKGKTFKAVPIINNESVNVLD